MYSIRGTWPLNSSLSERPGAKTWLKFGGLVQQLQDLLDMEIFSALYPPNMHGKSPKVSIWKETIHYTKSEVPKLWTCSLDWQGAIATRKPKLDAFKQPASSIPPTLEKLVSDRRQLVGHHLKQLGQCQGKALTWHQCEPWTSLVLAPYTVGQK